MLIKVCRRILKTLQTHLYEYYLGHVKNIWTQNLNRGWTKSEQVTEKMTSEKKTLIFYVDK